MPIRVVVCDQLPIERAGVCAALNSASDIAVVGSTDDGAQAITLTRQTHPHVVLTDIPLMSMTGIELTRRLTGHGGPGGVPVVVFTTADDEQSVLAALEAGASGFIAKRTTPQELAKAVRVVADGYAILEPVAARRLLDRVFGSRRLLPNTSASLARLSHRELEVLQLIGGGSSNEEIAGSLSVTITTVRSHIYHLRCKLDVRDRSQLVLVAFRSGLLSA